MKSMNVLIVGVGGQGVLLASELLSDAALRAGFDVKKSEVHGMAQRGGSVSSHVRIAGQVRSPLIPAGQAEALMAFEQAEALRWVHFLRADGTAVVNRKRLVPPVALFRTGPGYPDDPLSSVRARSGRVVSIDAEAAARRLGNPRVENTVLLGALSGCLEIPETAWMQAIEARVPAGTIDINREAFRAGAGTAVNGEDA
ncbi:indolepyruvate oxidoreductase subunit beta [bacterium]|nr:indolepyruvate oxidoreductase subunit beta [bacterium]